MSKFFAFLMFVNRFYRSGYTNFAVVASELPIPITHSEGSIVVRRFLFGEIGNISIIEIGNISIIVNRVIFVNYRAICFYRIVFGSLLRTLSAIRFNPELNAGSSSARGQ